MHVLVKYAVTKYQNLNHDDLLAKSVLWCLLSEKSCWKSRERSQTKSQKFGISIHWLASDKGVIILLCHSCREQVNPFLLREDRLYQLWIFWAKRALISHHQI